MSHSADSDSVLVQKTLWDREVFAILIERYEAKLDRYLSRLGIGDEEDRRDLLQDIFISAYKNLNAFDTSLSFSSWIYRITHNMAMSFHRHQSAHPLGVSIAEGDMVIEGLRDEAMDTTHIAERNITSEHVGRALSKIDEKYRSAIVLRYFEEKEYKEISDILEMPVGTVSVLIHRAKQALRKELAHLK